MNWGVLPLWCYHFDISKGFGCFFNNKKICSKTCPKVLICQIFRSFSGTSQMMFRSAHSALQSLCTTEMVRTLSDTTIHWASVGEWCKESCHSDYQCQTATDNELKEFTVVWLPPQTSDFLLFPTPRLRLAPSLQLGLPLSHPTLFLMSSFHSASLPLRPQCLSPSTLPPALSIPSSPTDCVSPGLPDWSWGFFRPPLV